MILTSEPGRLDVLWYAKKQNRQVPHRKLFHPPQRVLGARKPTGGLWTSPLMSPYGWKEWCTGNEPGWLGRSWLLTAGPCSLVVIDSLDDARVVMDRWGTQRDGLDWQRILDDGYDGIWLTTRGEHTTRFPELFNELDGDIHSQFDALQRLSFYGWDCETVLWLRWKFVAVKPWNGNMPTPQAHPVVREIR